MREKSGGVTEEDWELRWQAIVAEHEVDGAREQLIAGWKTWLEERNSTGGGRPAAGAVTAVAPIQIVQDKVAAGPGPDALTMSQ